MANQQETTVAGKKDEYRAVQMPMIASPCRACTETLCNRLSCESLTNVRRNLLTEFSGYGVSDNNW